jgi:penicillin-binding protein 1A
MGRDDAKPVGGLQGGRAPAKAFADYMRVAVARRPVEAFDTEVKLPDWQLEDEGEVYMGEPGEGGLVDENGMPIELPVTAPVPDADAPPPADDGPVLDQQWIEEQTGRRGSGDNNATAPRNGGQTRAPAAPKVAPPVVKTSPPRNQQSDDFN